MPPAVATQPSLPPQASLTSNDAHVLSALFDPESSPSVIEIVQKSQTLPHIPESDLPALQAAERAAIIQLNTQNPSHDTVTNAISALTNLIDSYPNYASAHANRAQAVRLLIGDDIFIPTNRKRAAQLFSDLSRAITLATPFSPQDAFSPLQARILAAAHTHRGYLLMKAATAASNSRTGTLEEGPEELQRVSSDQLEEMASRDLFFGGRYGDKTASMMAVRTNPYAKMCGAIVKEAIRKERDEYSARSGVDFMDKQ